jgi:hypothetical protein
LLLRSPRGVWPITTTLRVEFAKMNAEMLSAYSVKATCFLRGIPNRSRDVKVAGAMLGSPFTVNKGTVVSALDTCRAVWIGAMSVGRAVVVRGACLSLEQCNPRSLRHIDVSTSTLLADPPVHVQREACLL